MDNTVTYLFIALVAIALLWAVSNSLNAKRERDAFFNAPFQWPANEAKPDDDARLEELRRLEHGHHDAFSIDIHEDFWDQLADTKEALRNAVFALWPDAELETLEALNPEVREAVLLMFRAYDNTSALLHAAFSGEYPNRED